MIFRTCTYIYILYVYIRTRHMCYILHMKVLGAYSIQYLVSSLKYWKPLAMTLEWLMTSGLFLRATLLGIRSGSRWDVTCRGSIFVWWNHWLRPPALNHPKQQSPTVPWSNQITACCTNLKLKHAEKPFDLIYCDCLSNQLSAHQHIPSFFDSGIASAFYMCIILYLLVVMILISENPFLTKYCTSWWFQTVWKILVKMGIFPK